MGPFVTAKALRDARVRRSIRAIVFGDASLAPTLRGLPHVELRAVSDLPRASRVPGRPSRLGGRAQLAYVNAALDAARLGEAQALCTAPVSKAAIAQSGTPFVGHTEHLARAFGCEVMMLMAGPRLNVALFSNHVSLRSLPRLVTRRAVARKLQFLSRAWERLHGRAPRIAVCGLNPHAGDDGLLGAEEHRAIAPGIATARRLGVKAEGPFAADGLFAKYATRAPYDVVLAMFHDQGLVAAKALDFERTVNVTLGLPVPRTSPDHGVAYDIAPLRTASAEPMVQALMKAGEYARRSKG